MKKLSTQIEAKEYQTLDYLDKPRWISMWHQINEVARSNPRSVLEVGIGNRVVSYVLTMLGFKVTSVDIDKKVKPHYIGDVRKLPFRENIFDTILCAQVLEHIPFSDFPQALKELYRVSRNYVVITLPHDYLTYFLISHKIIPFIKQHTFFFIVPRNQTHAFNGQHYWEIGKKGYPLQKINRLIEKTGFTIIKTYCLSENPYHRFFILKK